MTYSPAREVPFGGGLTLEEFQQSIYYDIRKQINRAGYVRFDASDEELEILIRCVLDCAEYCEEIKVIIRYILDRSEYCRSAFQTNTVPQKGTNK